MWWRLIENWRKNNRMNKEKIFLVLATLKQGGAERVMSELANQWASEKYDVHLILLANSEHFYNLHENVTRITLGLNHSSFTQKIFAVINVIIKLRQLLKKERPDFVLCFGPKYNIMTIVAGRFLNLNIFVSDRSNPKRRPEFYIHLLRKLTYRFATGIIAQTSLAKEILGKSTKNRNIKVIPNPIKKINEYPHLKRENIILNVGRLVPEKGQKYLIESFFNIKDSSWKLVILGEGPLQIQLEDQIERLGIQDRVYMPGAVKNVDEWLAKSSIFAFSSISEGFPNALLEAMSSGLPCVSFDCDSGPRDVIMNGKNGFLISPRDTEEFKRALELLINNQTLRISLGNEAEITASKFDTEFIAEQYLSFCLAK